VCVRERWERKLVEKKDFVGFFRGKDWKKGKWMGREGGIVKITAGG
jgi:hypothetical protein